MKILRCRESDISDAGVFYDRVVFWMDQNGRNYPKWKYQIYPSKDSVRSMTDEESQYLCVEDGRIIGAFVLNSSLQ